MEKNIAQHHSAQKVTKSNAVSSIIGAYRKETEGMDWITGVQKAIDYVEDHITENIDYEEVAKQAYSSSFHFQRVFSILCGFTLGEYIRSRRLSLAEVNLCRRMPK